MSVSHAAAATRIFMPWMPGADVAPLRLHENGGVTTLTRFAAGARGAYHTHPGGEELYVLSGHARIGAIEVRAGDYLFTPAGEGHDVEAFEETLLLLVLPQAPDYSATPPPGS